MPPKVQVTKIEDLEGILEGSLRITANVEGFELLILVPPSYEDYTEEQKDQLREWAEARVLDVVLREVPRPDNTQPTIQYVGDSFTPEQTSEPTDAES